VGDNHALAATARILTTGTPEERYIITNHNPPPFGSPPNKPVEPKLRDIESTSVREQVGVMHDNGSVRASKNQGLI
jgi:hypothetical protein